MGSFKGERAFSLVEVLISSIVLVALIAPLYFVFFTASRGVETNARTLQAVMAGTEVMSQILGADRRAGMLFYGNGFDVAGSPDGFFDLESEVSRHGIAGIPLVSTTFWGMVHSRIYPSPTRRGFYRAYRFRRVSQAQGTVNFAPANLIEVCVRVRFDRPGTAAPGEVLLSTLLARPRRYRSRKELGLPEDEEDAHE